MGRSGVDRRNCEWRDVVEVKEMVEGEVLGAAQRGFLHAPGGGKVACIGYDGWHLRKKVEGGGGWLGGRRRRRTFAVRVQVRLEAF